MKRTKKQLVTIRPQNLMFDMHQIKTLNISAIHFTAHERKKTTTTHST